MASVYLRRTRLWARVKDAAGKWTAKATPFSTCHAAPDDDTCPDCAAAWAKARRYATRGQEVIDARRAEAASGEVVATVAQYGEAWAAERQARGVASARMSICRLRRHAWPTFGKLRLDEVRPAMIRDFVRKLRTANTLAPRTQLHIIGDLKGLFDDAAAAEVIEVSPVRLRRGELPQKTDADPNWRPEATYERHEVAALITDERLAPDRRMLHALKVLAALRHGEAAGLRWSAYDAAMKPLGRLRIVTSYDKGKPKTGFPRHVPVIPTLANLLDGWRATGWQRVYGRPPTDDDLVVPSRTMKLIDASRSAKAFRAELALLGLRVKAGSARSRGGHDLRAWAISEALATRRVTRPDVRVVTHGPPKDVLGGYTRFPWPIVCDFWPLPCPLALEPQPTVATRLVTGSVSALNIRENVVGTVGIEPLESLRKVTARNLDSEDADHANSTPEHEDAPMRVTRLATLDAAVAAVRAGAHDAALALLDVLRAQLVERPGEPEAATSDARRALRVVK